MPLNQSICSCISKLERYWLQIIGIDNESHLEQVNHLQSYFRFISNITMYFWIRNSHFKVDPTKVNSTKERNTREKWANSDWSWRKGISEDYGFIPMKMTYKNAPKHCLQIQEQRSISLTCISLRPMLGLPMAPDIVSSSLVPAIRANVPFLWYPIFLRVHSMVGPVVPIQVFFMSCSITPFRAEPAYTRLCVDSRVFSEYR